MKKRTVAQWAFVLTLLAAACGEPGDGGRDATRSEKSPEKDIASLAAAADRAEEAGSAHILLTAAVGGHAALVLEGDADFESEAAALTMDAAGLGLGSGTLKMVMEGDYLFMKMPPGPRTPRGWIRIDMADLPGFENQMNLQPAQYLEFLRGVAEEGIEEVGTEDIDGDTTTHLRAEISLAKFFDRVPKKEADRMRRVLAKVGEVDSIPIDVWIDEDGLPRRITLEVGATDATRAIVMTAEFSDYGVPVDVEPPKRFKELPAA